MLEWLTDSSVSSAPVTLVTMGIRLIAAALFGTLVAVAYRLHRRPVPIPATFPLTLVLLSILIAMVMQVIDDRVARAFSLVGALSIVRFRTVLDDTEVHCLRDLRGCGWDGSRNCALGVAFAGRLS